MAILAHCELPGAGTSLLLRGAPLAVGLLGPVGSSGAAEAIEVVDEGEAASARAFEADSLPETLAVQLQIEIWSTLAYWFGD